MKDKVAIFGEEEGGGGGGGSGEGEKEGRKCIQGFKD